RAAGGPARPGLLDPDPAGGGSSGWTVTPLGNGNVVVTDPQDGFVAPGSGAVYLFAGRTGALLADLVGSSANDGAGGGGGGGRGPGPDGPQSQVASGGVTALANGNYVVASPSWNGNLGAATWGDGTVGISGTVDASNSLVGSNPNDQVSYGTNGRNGVT